jgi:uncharacterized membrane protein YhhN
MGREPALTDFWGFTVETSQEAVALYLAPLAAMRNTRAARPSWLQGAAGVVVLLLALAMATPHRKGPHFLIVVPLALGALSSAALLRESLRTQRGLVAKICFGAAGFVLLMETLLLVLARP